MVGLSAKGMRDCSAGLVVAAFDRWEDLRSALELIESSAGCCFRAVLHARQDAADNCWLFEVVDEVAAVDSMRQRSCKTRERGPLANALSARFASGARTLTEALQEWMSADQAAHLEKHVDRGRLLLWVQPVGSEQFGCVCGRLVQASTHVVDVCEFALTRVALSGQAGT
jgi:hypothetical protein